MKFEEVKKLIIDLLQKDLDKRLYYHSLWHTQNVIETVSLYCDTGNIDVKDSTIIKTAALFHDTGFLKTYKGHEKESVKLAKEILPKYNYDSHSIDIISEAIIATEIPQSPLSLHASILCDADLDYFGRSDFYMIAHSLRMEWDAILDRKLSLKEWYEQQVKFLQMHSYHTQIAKDLREDRKQFHIKEMKELLDIK